MMRTLTTLLLLVCFAWSQAAAAGCQASGPGGASNVHADAPAHHHGHHAPAPAGSNDPHRHGPAHASTGCGMLNACGAATAPPVLAQPTAAFAQAGHGLRAERDAYTSPTRSTEPPPPRVALRS